MYIYIYLYEEVAYKKMLIYCNKSFIVFDVILTVHHR